MNDKHRLSSEQALDDYFFDLLIEPEEVESEDIDTKGIDTKDAEPAQEPSPLIDEIDSGTQQDLEQVSDTVVSDDSGSEQEPEHQIQDDNAAPFDFEQLSEPSGDSDEEGQATISVEINLSPPSDKASGWVPQVREEPVETRQPESKSSILFAEKPQTELEGVQRLLSQMSQMQSEIRHESDALITEQMELAVELAEQVVEEVVLEETATVPAIEPFSVEPESNDVELEPEVEQPAPEPEQAQPEELVAPETQPGSDGPPDVWRQQQDRDAEFQALFFEVNGVTFAVPLTELGGIHQLGEVNHLLGRPPWYLGLMTNREHQLDVVDTARWVMPEKLSSNEHQEEYRYIVMLGESKWGLACNVLHGTETLTEQSVRWREQAGKRPWLAGMVKEKMCALIHVSELISMLNAGLDVKSVM